MAFYFVRHGESFDNANGRTPYGTNCPGLTANGAEQVLQAAQNFIDEEYTCPDVIICSTILRAKQTAAILSDRLNVAVDERSILCERDMGEWEGQDLDIVKNYLRQGLEPPDGEKNIEFLERVRSAFDQLTQTSWKNMMIVSHWGVLYGLASLYEKQSSIKRMLTAEISRVDLSQDNISVHSLYQSKVY